MPTRIEWADETINPIQDVIKGESGRGYHCTKVSPGCDHCYAESMNKRFGNGLPFNGRAAEFELVHKELEKPLRWKKPKRIFVQSMGDLFHPDVSVTLLESVLATITLCPQHTFIILTKRPERMGLLTKDRLRISRTDTWPIKNLWLGVTTETQEQADKRIPLLLQIPAAVYLITHEPALGAITYPPEFLALGNRAWLINGGESGAGARPMHPDIPRHDRDQCQAAGVPFFFKGWGEFIGIDYHPEECPPGYDGWRCADGQFHDEIKTKPNGSRSIRVGKKAAGRLLDGRTWEEYPK